VRFSGPAYPTIVVAYPRTGLEVATTDPVVPPADGNAVNAVEGPTTGETVPIPPVTDQVIVAVDVMSRAQASRTVALKLREAPAGTLAEGGNTLTAEGVLEDAIVTDAEPLIPFEATTPPDEPPTHAPAVNVVEVPSTGVTSPMPPVTDQVNEVPVASQPGSASAPTRAMAENTWLAPSTSVTGAGPTWIRLIVVEYRMSLLAPRMSVQTPAG